METISASKTPPILYVVAGPPGVGKSTNGEVFVPYPVKVLNHDGIEAEYKKSNIPDYAKRANEKMWSSIHENIALGIDFGIELNLGTEDQYGLLRRTHNYCTHYQVHMLLFFTDIYSLCTNRAEVRARAGGHEVEPLIIQDMLFNTIGLLRKNIASIDHLTFIDVTYNSVELVYSGYYPTRNHEFVSDVLPNWVTTNFPEISFKKI